MSLITGLALAGLGLAGGFGSLNASKSNARTLARERDFKIEQRKKEILKLVGKQKVLYGQSGVELEGTPQALIQDTYNTGIEDINPIESSYNQAIKNSLRQGRAALLGSLTSSILSVYKGTKDIYWNEVNDDVKTKLSSIGNTVRRNKLLGQDISNMGLYGYTPVNDDFEF